ncbi:MAG: PAS domain S-box protein [bacterium]|nr:PAS domain S-box protein [bacterium]
MKGKQEKALYDLEEELLFISNLASVQNYHQNTAQASNDLYHFMLTKNGFDQIRILDNLGHETIRVNAGIKPTIVDSTNLQDKSQRAYFLKAKKLKKGEYYKSPIELNKEFGKVEIPKKPVVRLVSPIYKGEVRVGYMVINYLVLHLLDNYDFRVPNGNRFDIIDDRGTSLVSLMGADNKKRSDFPAHKRTESTNRENVPISEFRDGDFQYMAVQMDAENSKLADFGQMRQSSNSSTEFTLLHATPLEHFSVLNSDFFWVLLISYLLFTMLYAFGYYSLRRKHIQHADSELKLHSIFNKSLSFVGLLTPDGTLLEANDTALKFGGFTRKQAVGNKFWDAPWWSISEEIKQRLQLAINEAAKGESVRYDVEVLGAGGKRIIIDFSLQPVFDEEGKVVYIIPEGRDITEKVALQKEIESNNDIYKAVQKLSNTGVWSIDLKQNQLEWDDIVCDIHEVEHGTILNVEEAINFYREDFRELVRNYVDDGVKSNQSWDFEAILVSAKGNEVWVRALGYPVFENEELVALRGTFTNIDARKRNEQKLLDQEKRLRLALDSASLGMWDWDMENDVLNWDEALYDIYGIKESDFSGAYDAWVQSVHPEDIEEAQNRLNNSIDQRKSFHATFRIITPNGEIRHLQADASVIKDALGKPIRMIGVNKDITERVENENRIKELNANLEDMVAERTAELNSIRIELEQQLGLLGVSAMVSETNLKGEIISANDTFAKTCGYNAEELLGKNHNLLRSGVQTTDTYKCLWSTISSGGTWQGELCNKKKTGELYWVHATIQPFMDEEKNISRYVGVYFDITELKRSTQKLSEMNSQLDAANRELETFSYSVSHDLKAPLRALQGFSKNMLERYESNLDETGTRWLHFIQDNASRMDNLIGDILSYSKIGQAPMKKLNFSMKTLVEERISSIKEGYGNIPEITIMEKLPDVPSDPTMIGVVWQNLIDNAFKYSQKTDKPKVSIWAESSDEGVTYFIKDNGSGFDMRHYDKLFGIFQRLHAQNEFEGTGVGLANVQRIITKHNGSISAIGEVGKGATFQFFIPN